MDRLTNLVCRRCKTAIDERRVPVGKAGRYLQVIGCECQDASVLEKYQNTTFPEDRTRKSERRAEMMKDFKLRFARIKTKHDPEDSDVYGQFHEAN